MWTCNEHSWTCVETDLPNISYWLEEVLQRTSSIWEKVNDPPRVAYPLSIHHKAFHHRKVCQIYEYMSTRRLEWNDRRNPSPVEKDDHKRRQCLFTYLTNLVRWCTWQSRVLIQPQELRFPRVSMSVEKTIGSLEINRTQHWGTQIEWLSTRVDFRLLCWFSRVSHRGNAVNMHCL